MIIDESTLAMLVNTLSYVKGATNSLLFGNLGLNIVMSASL